MSGRILVAASILTVALCIVGCGCSGRGLEGDTGIVGDTPAGDPSWDPSVDSLGEPGWRESAEPWCPGTETAEAYDVWSYSGGVYVVVSDSVTTDELGTVFVNHIYFNDGTGWTTPYEEPVLPDGPFDYFCFQNIAGTPSGLLFNWSEDYDCQLMEIEEGEIQLEDFVVSGMFVVRDDLAYACADVGLMQFDGSDWTRIDLEGCGRTIWANVDYIFSIGGAGVVNMIHDGARESYDTGTLSRLTAIWGFSENDVWIGTEESELLHWNGATWEDIEWPNMNDDSDPCRQQSSDEKIVGMWGTDNILFFHTDRHLVMWDGTDFQVLAYWAGEYREMEGGFECDGSVAIRAIWGNSPSEVFIAALDGNHVSADCGPEYLLWWDGSHFHWF